MGYLSYLLESDLVELAIAVAVAFSFVDLVQAVVRAYVGPAVIASTSPPQTSPPLASANFAYFVLPALLAFAVSILLAAVYLVLRLRLPLDPTKRACPECLSEIPVEARRCAYCTAEVNDALPPRPRRRPRPGGSALRP